MKKYILFLFLFLSFHGYCKTWELANNFLKVSFDDQSSILKVLDLRNQKMWEQMPLSAKTVKVSKQNKDILQLNVVSDFEYQVLIKLNSAEVEFTLHAIANQKMEADLEFPSAFKAPNEKHLLVLTDGEGLLLPVNDKNYPVGSGISYYCGGGLSMPWMGIVDENLKAGYMAILETPFDAALKTERREGRLTFQPVWLSSKETFSYDRKITYAFFNEGGYVAQCKRYRDYIWKKNSITTLKQKSETIPAIKKMVGGVHIYVWDNARNASFSQKLKDAGIDKAMFLWNPNHLPYPASGYNDSLKNMGYAVGSYELYTDSNPRDTVFSDLSKSPIRFKLNSFPGLFNQIAARKKDGTTYSNQFGHYTNPKAILPEVMKRTSQEMKIWPHETYFVDVVQANGLYEDYSKQNPLTRKEWAQAHINILQNLIDKYHVFLGAEWGADFAVNQSVYAHGMMTLQHTWFNTEINSKGTIYYYGDWRDGKRPSIMLGQRTAPPLYMQYSINEKLRVPLYELVYHDAVVTSWRWEDGNHHTPEIWWKKDLFNILYGSAPLWSLDQSRWDAFKNTFVESYKNVCPWLQQIAYDEMTNHKFITADGKIQESSFSSGKKVVVNFGDSDYLFNGKTVKSRSYLVN